MRHVRKVRESNVGELPRPWERYLSVGIVHPMAFPETAKGEGPIVETIEKIIADDFFSAIEVTRIVDPKVRSEVVVLLRSRPMDVIFLGQAPLFQNNLNLNAADEGERQKAIRLMKDCVDMAYELGAAIAASVSGPDPGDAERRKTTERLADSFREICRYALQRATDYVLTVSLEPFDRTLDRKRLIGPTTDAVRLCELVKEDCDNFGLTVDLSHLPLLGETSQECLGLCIEHLVHAHAGNCVLKDKSHPSYGDQHPRFGIAGGENDVPELVDYLKALRGVGYFSKKLPTRKPVLSFEVKPMAGETSAAVISDTQRVMREAWAKLGDSGIM